MFTHTGNQLAAVTTTVATTNSARVGEGFVWTTDPATGETHGQIALTSGTGGTNGTPVNPAAGWSQARVDATFYALVCDLAGAPQELINTTTGTVEGHTTQTLYGKRTWAGRCTSPLLFAGQYEDAESGWAYNRFRYYNPTLGAYNAQDPLGLAPRLASAQGYVDHAAYWVDILGLASHVKNTGLQKQIDALSPNQKGALGEELAQRQFKGQFDDNKIRSSYEGISGKDRITDITLTDRSIVEAKFVKSQGLSAQLKDGIAQAKADNAAYHLVTAPETKLSRPLKAAIKRGDVVHHTMSEADIAQAITKY